MLQLLTVPGCQAGTGVNALELDFGQVADAATIAGVAASEHLPAKALTIAYATAFQESKLENLTYGDRDSVGIFQQRPSEGWGTAAELQDPAYAARAFFERAGQDPALPDDPGVPGRPGRAAQRGRLRLPAVRADRGAAGGGLHHPGRTRSPAGTARRAQAAAANISPKLNFNGAAEGAAGLLWRSRDRGQVVTEVSRSNSGLAITLHATSGRGGWTVASWLVAIASYYGITQVSYARASVVGPAHRDQLADRPKPQRRGVCRPLAGRATILLGT